MVSPAAVRIPVARSVPLDRLKRRSEADVGAHLAMPVEEEGRDLARDGAAHQPVRRLQEHDVLAQRPDRRGDLEADEAAADDGDGVRLGHPRPQMLRILGGAQLVDAGKRGARHGQRAVGGAGGDHQMIVRKGLAGRERDGRGVPVDRNDALAAPERDPVLLVKALRPQQEAVEVGVGLDVGLRERRALIGETRLLGDDGDVPLIAELPETGGDLEAGLAAAGDDDAGHQPRPAERRRPVSPPATDMVLYKIMILTSRNPLPGRPTRRATPRGASSACPGFPHSWPVRSPRRQNRRSDEALANASSSPPSRQASRGRARPAAPSTEAPPGP